MPSRIFDHFDIINIVEGYALGPSDTNLTTSLTSSRFGAFNLSGSGSDATVSGSAVSSQATYQQQGDIDFTRFPSIPRTAIITKLRIRTSSFVSAGLSANTGRENTCSAMVIATAGGLSVSEIDVETGPPGNLGILNVNVSLNISESLSGPAADQVIDFSSSPIDFNTLVASYGTVILSIDEWIVTTANGSVGGNNASAAFTVGFSEYEIEVTYQLSYTWTLENPTVPIKAGDTVTITSPPGGMDFTQIQSGDEYTDAAGDTQIESGVTLSYTDATGTEQTVNVPVSDIIAQTETLLSFTIPNWFLIIFYYISLFPLDTLVPVDVSVIGNGTQFSGSVLLGTLNIYIADSSGIYVLDVDQTSDLLYFRLGYTTSINLLMLPNGDDEGDDFYELLQYSSGIFLQDDIDDDNDDDLLVTSNLIPSVAILSVKIPDPYIKTAFLP